jgi:hypothetical protein
MSFAVALLLAASAVRAEKEPAPVPPALEMNVLQPVIGIIDDKMPHSVVRGLHDRLSTDGACNPSRCGIPSSRAHARTLAASVKSWPHLSSRFACASSIAMQKDAAKLSLLKEDPTRPAGTLRPCPPRTPRIPRVLSMA